MMPSIREEMHEVQQDKPLLRSSMVHNIEQEADQEKGKSHWHSVSIPLILLSIFPQ